MWTTIFVFAGILAALFAFSRFRNWTKWKMRDEGRITEEKTLDEWVALVNKAAAKADQTLEKLARAIEAGKIPNISVSKKTVRLGRDPRPFLVIEHDFLKGYFMYVGALPYGADRLNVVWYLVLDTPEIAAARRNARHGTSDPTAWLNAFFKGGYNRILNMSILDKLELTNYVSLVHGIVVEETKNLMKELNLDFSKVDTHTKGFLNLS